MSYLDKLEISKRMIAAARPRRKSDTIEYRRAKLIAKHHFLRSVMKGEKIFLIGDGSELARLAKK